VARDGERGERRRRVGHAALPDRCVFTVVSIVSSAVRSVLCARPHLYCPHAFATARSPRPKAFVDDGLLFRLFVSHLLTPPSLPDRAFRRIRFSRRIAVAFFHSGMIRPGAIVAHDRRDRGVAASVFLGSSTGNASRY